MSEALHQYHPGSNVRNNEAEEAERPGGWHVPGLLIAIPDLHNEVKLQKDATVTTPRSSRTSEYKSSMLQCLCHVATASRCPCEDSKVKRCLSNEFDAAADVAKQQGKATSKAAQAAGCQEAEPALKRAKMIRRSDSKLEESVRAELVTPKQARSEAELEECGSEAEPPRKSQKPNPRQKSKPANKAQPRPSEKSKKKPSQQRQPNESQPQPEMQPHASKPQPEMHPHESKPQPEMHPHESELQPEMHSHESELQPSKKTKQQESQQQVAEDTKPDDVAAGVETPVSTSSEQAANNTETWAWHDYNQHDSSWGRGWGYWYSQPERDYESWGGWKHWGSGPGWGWAAIPGALGTTSSQSLHGLAPWPPSTCDLFDYDSANTPASKQTSSPAASEMADTKMESKEKGNEAAVCEEQKQKQAAAEAEQEQQRQLQKAHHAKYMRFYRSLEGPSLTTHSKFRTLDFPYPPRSQDPGRDRAGG